MALYQWFDRFLGQVVAPDDKYDPDLQVAVIPSIFDIVAPDPHFSASLSATDSDVSASSSSPSSPPPPSTTTTTKSWNYPPSSVFQNIKSPAASSSSSSTLVTCEHCGRLTPCKPSGMCNESSEVSSSNNINSTTTADLVTRTTKTTSFQTPENNTSNNNDNYENNDNNTNNRSNNKNRSMRRTPTRRNYSTPNTNNKIKTPGSAGMGMSRSTTKKSRSRRHCILSPELKDRLAMATSETAEWNDSLSSKRRHSFALADSFLNKFLLPPLSRDAQAKAATYLKDMKVMLDKDSWLLTDVRTTARSVYGAPCPEGYTPLMAAVFINHEEAVRLFLSLIDDPDELLKVNLQGQQASHIACKMGHETILEMLQEASERLLGSREMLEPDVFGQTPLASAFRSPIPSARICQTVLLKQPWTRKDRCVFGDTAEPRQTNKTNNRDGHDAGGSSTTNATLFDRVGYDLCLQLQSGHAEMAGRRGYMEDALLVNYYDSTIDSTNDDDGGVGIVPPPPHIAAAVFGVLDGHDDDGLVSSYVAERIEQEVLHVLSENKKLRPQEPLSSVLDRELEKVYLQIDAELKCRSDMKGGTTAVVAIVTTEDLVVANVGDSRCILVQEKVSAPTNDGHAVDEVTNQMAKLNVDKAHPGASPEISVSAMSEDHKPNLEGERSRIERLANMHVREIEFKTSDGQSMVIHKLVKTKKSGTKIAEMATSRAFGDHEFKLKKDTEPRDQAVIAVPEVLVQSRSPRDLFLVLACDGIWDVMTNQQVGIFVTEHVTRMLQQQEQEEESQQGRSQQQHFQQYILPAVADLLVQECFRLNSKDNLSVVIIALGDMADRVGIAAALGDASAANVDSAKKVLALDFSASTPPLSS